MARTGSGRSLRARRCSRRRGLPADDRRGVRSRAAFPTAEQLAERVDVALVVAEPERHADRADGLVTQTGGEAGDREILAQLPETPQRLAGRQVERRLRSSGVAETPGSQRDPDLRR